MLPIFGPAAWVRSFWVPPGEVRAEVWALGGRHRGRVMEGARLEAKVPGISQSRAILLTAVMRTYPGSPAAKQAARS